jgi:predicted Rossmann fold flavoprotein
LMSGGTRCNITNARGLRRLEAISGPVDPVFDRSLCQGNRAIQQAYGDHGKFLGPALKRLDVDATISLFENAGVATKVEGNGKIFPVSDKAADVLGALVDRLEKSGAELRCLSPVTGLERLGTGFRVMTPGGSVTSARVIMTVGGRSYPGCGTTGDGYVIAQQFGHSIVETKPALVPIRVGVDWVSGLKGLTLADTLTSVHAGTELLQERREAVLFAHFGLTGPAILDVSRSVARSNESQSLELRIDLLPSRSREELDRRLQEMSRQGKRAVANLLPDEVPRRLVEFVLAAAEIPATRTGPDLSREERRRLVAVLKGLTLPIVGTLGFEKAEVTSGGVALEQVDSRTLESLIVPGLYFAGEILDLDGLIGGFNFQAAWSTGWLAAENAAALRE